LLGKDTTLDQKIAVLQKLEKLLLEKYYDTNYGLDKISFVYTVNSDDVDSCVLELESIKKDLKCRSKLKE
jgi:hypothetical protein